MIPCPRCLGSGRVHLEAILFQTLRAVIEADDWITATELAGRIGWDGSLSAINNRLRELQRLGLVEREVNSPRRHIKFRAAIYSR